MRSLVVAAAGAALGLSGAWAQDPGGDPYYGSVTLEGGFTEDPYTVSIAAGGSVDSSGLGGGCVGMVGDPPDFDLYYTPGGLPLYISAVSDSDVSLVVNLPDGTWACDDDSGGNLNPLLQFDNPQSGLYDIWVGRVGGSGDMPNATLYISELSGGVGGSASLGGTGIEIGGTPYFGSVTLASGFAEDPYSVGITAGGSNDASTLGAGCVGMIGGPPDFNLSYSSGSYPLYLSATSDADLTLVVNTPDGGWACDDDGADSPLDPGLMWSKPASGLYNVWVGHYGGGDTPQATLHISETGYHTTRVGGGSGGAIDAAAAPTYGDVRLVAGFVPDPHTLTVTPGGTIDARTVNDACVGQVASAPDIDLYYTAGAFPLYIFVESSEDTTLVVNTPDGQWICDDDAGVGVNPGLGFKAPASGLYDVWVGRYGGGVSGSATLNISETTFPTD
jgi:hypothetical protein